MTPRHEACSPSSRDAEGDAAALGRRTKSSSSSYGRASVWRETSDWAALKIDLPRGKSGGEDNILKREAEQQCVSSAATLSFGCCEEACLQGRHSAKEGSPQLKTLRREVDGSNAASRGRAEAGGGQRAERDILASFRGETAVQKSAAAGHADERLRSMMTTTCCWCERREEKERRKAHFVSNKDNASVAHVFQERQSFERQRLVDANDLEHEAYEVHSKEERKNLLQ